MDTSYVVKDMNQMAFTRVPEWCPSVNSPPSFKKPIYKEILVQMNKKQTLELFSSDFLSCKPRSIMLVPEHVNLQLASPSMIMSNFTTSTGIASISGTSLNLTPIKK